MSVVNGFQVGSETLKYNYESLENYNTPDFSSDTSVVYDIGDYVMYNGKLYKCVTATTGGTWNSSDWEASILTEDINDIKNDIINLNSHLSDITTDLEEVTDSLDTKAPVILETASGAIASFSDGADGMPVKKLVAQIEPVQDLHGYDNPWPAGGWKNILGVTQYKGLYNERANTDLKVGVGSSYEYTLTGISVIATSNWEGRLFATPVLTAGTYYVHFGAGATNRRITLYLTDGDLVCVSLIRNAQNDAVDIAVTAEDGQRIAVYIGVSDAGAVTVPEMQVEKNSSYSGFAPYSNECPISGWTGAEISETGVNVWDEEWEVGGYADASGMPWNTSDRIRSKVNSYISARPSTRYFCKCPTSADLYFYDIEKNYISHSSIAANAVFITPDKCYYIRFATYATYGTTYNNDISINYPATDTEYHPYTGNQISVNWETEAGTVYGCTITLNPDRTGTLVVTDRKDVFDDVSNISLYWSQAGTYGNRFNLGLRTTNKMGSVDFVSNVLVPTNAVYSSANWRPYQGFPWRDNTNDFFLILPLEYTIDRIADAKALIASWGLEICYKLLNPIEIPLTASEVSGILTTLYGTNNVWCDTGDVEVTYPADTKLYIEKLTQPTEDDMTANTNIDINKFFMVGNSLYFSTVAIAAGETIVPGTNCNLVSLADALNQINV